MSLSQRLSEHLVPKGSIELGDAHGWWPLVLELDTKLRAIDPHYRLHQIKQKWAELRYYAEPSTAELRAAFKAAIDEATRRSQRICEGCGALGELCAVGGWEKVSCRPCFDAEVKRASPANAIFGLSRGNDDDDE